MKGDHQVIITVLAFFSGVIFNDLISNHNSYHIKDYIPALVALISVFVGARYAFLLKTSEDERKFNEDNISASNLISFNMILMYNRLLNYREQFIRIYTDNPFYFIFMPPSLHIKDEFMVDLNTLSFLINTDSENANLVAEISIAISKYRMALDAINMRSIFHREVIQPLLDKADIEENVEYEWRVFEKALGYKN